MRFRSLADVQKRTTPRPLNVRDIHIIDLPTWARSRFESTARDITTGLVKMTPLSSDSTTYSLEFDSVESARRAYAVLGDHPALEPFGVYCCAPGETLPPYLSEKFTVRIISAVGDFPDKSRVIARPAWMNKVRDVFDNHTPWPQGAPSPEELYDFCACVGLIFKLQMRARVQPWEPIWQCRVQFYNTSDADELQTRLQACYLYGWQVTCRKLQSDFDRAEMEAADSAAKALDSYVVDAQGGQFSVGHDGEQPALVGSTSSSPSSKTSSSSTDHAVRTPRTPSTNFEPLLKDPKATDAHDAQDSEA